MCFVKKILRYLPFILNPAFILAFLVAVNGCLFLKPVIVRTLNIIPDLLNSFSSWKELLSVVGLLEIPRFMLGIGLLLIAFGLLLRARVAWAFSLLLLTAMGMFNFWLSNGSFGLSVYAFVVASGLLVYWKQFNRSSLAASSLFALISVLSLLIYALFGTLYLGAQFSPPIEDLNTALYFSIVSMSTVGYGDILPHTPSARLFTVSIIVLGITVFATSVSAIIGPVIGGNLKRIVKGRFSNVMRKNHYIIAGASPLAVSVCEGLRSRGESVTVIILPDSDHCYPQETDIVLGDPSNSLVLAEAGADKAKCILALRIDDAENAFVILAAKEVGGTHTRTISVVNSSQNLQKIKRVQPDMVFSLQLLGSEILVRSLRGETIDENLITELFFGKIAE